MKCECQAQRIRAGVGGLPPPLLLCFWAGILFFCVCFSAFNNETKMRKKKKEKKKRCKQSAFSCSISRRLEYMNFIKLFFQPCSYYIHLNLFQIGNIFQYSYVMKSCFYFLAIWFRYDLSPITVKYVERRKPLYHFITTVCIKTRVHRRFLSRNSMQFLSRWSCIKLQTGWNCCGWLTRGAVLKLQLRVQQIL